MWSTRTGAAAVAVEPVAALFLAVAVCDALGLPAVSFYLLVLAVPLTAAAGLVCFARLVDAVNGAGADALGRAQAVLCALLVASVVLGAAVRGPVVGQDAVPHAATAALGLGFSLLVLQALVALVHVRR